MAKSKLTQGEKIVNYMMEFGGITQLEAIRDLGVMRLASRISDLKKNGIGIRSETITIKNRFGEDCHVSKYSLLEGRNENRACRC